MWVHSGAPRVRRVHSRSLGFTQARLVDVVHSRSRGFTSVRLGVVAFIEVRVGSLRRV